MEHRENSGRSAGDSSMTITLNRDKIINAVVVIQLALLIVFGVQIYGIKQQLGDGGSTAVAKADEAPSAKAADNTAPSAAPTAAAGGKVDVTVNDDDHVIGNPDASVTIVEYSDFECPFCGRAYPTVKQVLETYGDDVRLVYRHFPLSFHPQAQKAAEASECAADQGKFWEYHDRIFEEQTLLSGGVTQMKKWAGELGLNQSSFDNCLDSGEKASLVADDLNAGQSQGITGTPGFLINGTKVSGAQPFSAFQQVIDAELAG